jgi:hypothetical protein
MSIYIIYYTYILIVKMSWFTNLFSRAKPEPQSQQESQGIEMKGSPEQEKRLQELEQAAENAHDREKMKQRIVFLEQELRVERDPIEKLKKEIELTKLSCQYNELNPFLQSMCQQELTRLERLLEKRYEEQRLAHWDRSPSKSAGDAFFSGFGGGKKKSKKSKKSKRMKSKRMKSKKSKQSKRMKSKKKQ